MAKPTAPRKTCPRSPTLDAAHEVIRALGPRGGDGASSPEDADADSDLEMILTRSRGGAWPRDAAVTRTGKQAGKPLRSQGHHYARVMRQSVSGSLPL